MNFPVVEFSGAAVMALRLTEPGRPEAFGLQWVPSKAAGRPSCPGLYKVVDADRVKLLVAAIRALEPGATFDQRRVLAGARRMLTVTLPTR